MSIKRSYFNSAARIYGRRIKGQVEFSYKLESIFKRIIIASAFSERRNLKIEGICYKWINNVFEEKSCRIGENEHRKRKARPDDSK